MTPVEFAINVMTYCYRFDASITSYLRTTRHNASVGGVSNSPHLLGLGADVVYDKEVPLEDRKKTAAALRLLVIPEGDHDHLQPVDWRGH